MEPRSLSRRVLARTARRSRRVVTTKVDPLVERLVGGRRMVLPLSHDLPLFLAEFPRYGENLVDLVDVVVREKGFCGLVDIGANVGDTIVTVRSRVDVPVLGIEGDELYAGLLARNVATIPDVEIEQAYVASSLTVGPIRAVRTTGTAALVPSDAASTVVTRPLTAIIASHPTFAVPGIVKIDTDGADAAIVVANAEWFAQVRPILFLEYASALAAKAGDHEPWRAFADLALAGYRKAIVYVNTGELLLEASVSDERLWRDLARYRSSPAYFDVAVFPGDDTHLFERTVAQERARVEKSP
jgi:FkbM family methyltransferase